jgi:hypothetical protein
MPKSKDPWEPLESRTKKRIKSIHLSPSYCEQRQEAFQSFKNILSPEQAALPQSDLEEAFLFSKEGRDLAQKWGLTLALHPNDELWGVKPEHGPALFTDPALAVKVIPFGKTRLIPIPPEELSPEELALAEEWSRLDFTPNLRKGRYLRLEVDMHQASKEEAKALTAWYYDFYRPLVLRHPRLRKGKVDEWEVWNLYDQHRSLIKVARILKKKESTVRMAYYRAFAKIMKEKYDPAKHNPRQLPVFLDPDYCGRCPERDSCRDLCPTASRYADQETRPLREKPLPPSSLEKKSQPLSPVE